MDGDEKRTRGPGFMAGLRLGLGFMTGVAIFCSAAVCVLFLVAWLAFGSMRDMAVATVGGLGSVAGSAAHSVVSETRESALQVKDRLVGSAAATGRQIGDGAKDLGATIRDKASQAGGKAAVARDAIRDRAGALAGRIGFGTGKDGKDTEAEPPVDPSPKPVP